MPSCIISRTMTIIIILPSLLFSPFVLMVWCVHFGMLVTPKFSPVSLPHSSFFLNERCSTIFSQCALLGRQIYVSRGLNSFIGYDSLVDRPYGTEYTFLDMESNSVPSWPFVVMPRTAMIFTASRRPDDRVSTMVCSVADSGLVVDDQFRQCIPSWCRISEFTIS